MTSSAAQDHAAVVAALRAALAEGESGSHRPGLLRLRVEEALGADEARRLRPWVHQLVAAAEENLPAHLTRIAPLSAQSLERLSSDLAEARGWSQPAAQRTTWAWASALGYDDLVASSWPPSDRAGAALAPDMTQLPPPPPPPRPPAPPSPPAASTRWPRPARALRSITHAPSGEPAHGVVQAYAGAPILLVAAGMVVLVVGLCLPIVFLGTVGVLLPLLGTVAALGLVRLARYGALVASASGLSFTPYDGAMRRARPEEAVAVPWPQVEVRQGFVSVVQVAGRQLQVGPFNRAFARAAAAHAEGRG